VSTIPEPEAAEPDPKRAVRGVLAGGPVAVAGDVQAVVQALARIAAASIASRLWELGEPILSGLALGYAEQKLAQLVLADAVTTPDGLSLAGPAES
jgi:hypothetical protein